MVRMILFGAALFFSVLRCSLLFLSRSDGTNMKLRFLFEQLFEAFGGGVFDGGFGGAFGDVAHVG